MAVNSDDETLLHTDSPSSVVRLVLQNRTLTYTLLSQISQYARRVQEHANVRALAIELGNVVDDPELRGEWPQELVHRFPQGSQGPGPVVEQEVIQAIRECFKPTVALIDGDLNDFAIDIACACDIRIASDRSTLRDKRISQGRTAATGITYLLPRLIGLSQAMRILMMGETLSAADALKINFLHEVIPSENVEVRFQESVAKLSKMPTRAWEVHKMQVLPQLDQDFETAMVHSLGIRQTHVIKDRAEGIKAWRERRDPEFTGE